MPVSANGTSSLKSNAATRAKSSAQKSAVSSGQGGTERTDRAPSVASKTSSDRTSGNSYGESLAGLTQAQRDARAKAVSRGPGDVAGVMPGASSLSQKRTTQTLAQALSDSGIKASKDQIATAAKTIVGEAGRESPFGQTAVANTMLNRVALGPDTYPGGDFADVLGAFDANGIRYAQTNGVSGKPANAGYTKTQMGSDAYGGALASLAAAASTASKFAKEAPEELKNATHYFNPKEVSPSWGKDFDLDVGNHRFGNAEPTAAKVAEARNIPSGSMLPTPATSIGLKSPATAQPDFKPAVTLTGQQPTLAPTLKPRTVPDLAPYRPAAADLARQAAQVEQFKTLLANGGVPQINGGVLGKINDAAGYVKQFADAQEGFGSSITGKIADRIVEKEAAKVVASGSDWFKGVQDSFNNATREAQLKTATPTPASTPATADFSMPKTALTPAEQAELDNLPSEQWRRAQEMAKPAIQPLQAAPPRNFATAPQKSLLEQGADYALKQVAKHPVVRGVKVTLDILDNALQETFGSSISGDTSAFSNFAANHGGGKDTSQPKKTTEPTPTATAGSTTPNAQIAANKLALFGQPSTPEDWYARQREKLANEMRALGVPF